MGLFIEVLINDPFTLFMLPLKFIQSTAQLLMIDSSFLNAEESVSYIQIIDFFFLFVGGYRIVYKKVPQFIVPDLTGFEVPNKRTKSIVIVCKNIWITRS